MATQVYVLLGNPLSFVCGRGLESNPGASITWLDTNNMAIMDNARYDLENRDAIVRLNFTRTIPSDNGMWTCEVAVISERYVVNSEGELVRGGLAVIGNILRHYFIVTVIGKQSKCVTMTMLSYPIPQLLPVSHAHLDWKMLVLLGFIFAGSLHLTLIFLSHITRSLLDLLITLMLW